MNEQWTVFGERLKAELERQGMSYRTFSAKVGLTLTTTCRYAKSERVPRANEILKTAKVLGVTCDYLLGLSDDPHKTSKSEGMEEKEQQDADFWRRRAEEYSDVCFAITAEMTKGIKFDSIRIDENGITFGKERPERKVGEWVQVPRFEGDTQPDLECPFCKHKVGWWDMTKYCAECGADMRGKS